MEFFLRGFSLRLATALTLLWVLGSMGIGVRAVTLDLDPQAQAAEDFSLEVLSVSDEKKHTGRVYIYHTHTYEAYQMEGENTYQPTEDFRTADAGYNMIRVGEELKNCLESAGITVSHDTTAYEPPKLSTAYARSLEGVLAAAQEGYDLYLDLHRDSYSRGNGPNTSGEEEKAAARFLFLIGQGTGTSFDERPEWEENQRAAQLLSDSLNRQVENISRGVSLKSGRYNQQAATPSMLIEIGNNMNTLPEALRAVPYLAHAICEYFDTLE